MPTSLIPSAPTNLARFSRLAFGCVVKPCVRLVVFVTSSTMSSPRTLHIFRVRNSFEMIGVHAQRRCASTISNVVNLFVFGDWPNKQFVHYSVGFAGLAIDRHIPVSTRRRASPQPAGFCLVNEFPNTFSDGGGDPSDFSFPSKFGVSFSTFSLVVLRDFLLVFPIVFGSVFRSFHSSYFTTSQEAFAG
jgi:hypothetical protein